MLHALFIALLTLSTGWLAGAASMPDAAVQDAAASARVREAAERALAARYPDDTYRLDVRVKRIAATLEAGALVRLVFPAADALPRGTAQVHVFTGSDAAGWQKAGWALLYVAHFDSVLVARAPLRPDEAVTPEALGLAWMETTSFPADPLRPADLRALGASGAIFAARAVRAGQALRRGDVRGAYAAEAGTTVLMRYRRAGLAFELRCKARQPGYVGDEIRLYAADTGATYRARLTAPGAAEWLETL